MHLNLDLYFYRAIIVSVYDGDTVRANIDLGLDVWIYNEKLRLARINAPELRRPTLIEGRKSRDFLREKLIGKAVIVETIKDKKGSFGRYLAEIWLEDEDGNYQNINTLMLDMHLAVLYK